MNCIKDSVKMERRGRGVATGGFVRFHSVLASVFQERADTFYLIL